MCVISRRSNGYLFVAWRSRGVPLFDNNRFQLLVIKPFRIVKHMVFGVLVFLICLRAFQKRVGALLRLVGLPRAVFKATTKKQLSDVIGVRSGALFGQNGPGTREGCTFSKSCFLVFLGKSTLSVVFCVPLGAPGPLRAPSRGGPGAQPPEQGHGHSEASFRSCFAVAGGRPIEHKTRRKDVPNAFVATCVCSRTLVKYKVF